jgi:quercetin dioxygenase-like cupin family protein
MSVALARNVSRNRAWSGLRAFEATYAPHAVLEEHEHKRPIFTFVLGGAFDERAGGTTRRCQRGDVIFRAPQ